jgi:hypothetical protein
MATRRFKSPTMKFGVPLSVPGSRHVERCYARFHALAADSNVVESRSRTTTDLPKDA